jgi:hypothetical protein
MGLLQEIQADLFDPKSSIGPILLKLRYLADRLGSGPLEEWVKFETEGYPDGVSVPAYRQAAVTYRGTFTNGVQTLNEVPIPSALIENIAGEHWTTFSIRDSIAVIDRIVTGHDPKDQQNFGVPGGNLMLVLQGKVYPGHSIISVTGMFGGAPFASIHQVVRAKILDLTLALEKQVAIAGEVEIGKPAAPVTDAVKANVTQITNNTFYGGTHTTITNSGSVETINVSVLPGDQDSVVRWLVEQGAPEDDARELATIAASEKPENDDEPFGKRAKKWIGGKLSKGAAGLWNMGQNAGQALIIEAFKRYYGWDV